jgi:cell division protein FtsL
MVDWAGRIELRNYSIKRQTDRRCLKDMLALTAPAILLACSFGFYAWERCSIVDLGYQEQYLISQENSLRRDQDQLVIEEQTLKCPERIEAIAQERFRMVRMRTYQLMPVSSHETDLGRPATIALATVPLPPDPRKPSATN